MITIWKKQDQPLDQRLQQVAFQHLLRYRSEGVLSKIKRHLRVELLLISLLLVGFNGVFFLANLPLTSLRWMAFVTFNGMACAYGYRYVTVLTSLQYSSTQDLRATLGRFVSGLQRFTGQNKSFHLPLVIVGFLMCSVSQHLYAILPWLIGEFLLWKWVLTPRMNARFDWYLTDLEYTLKSLNES